MTRLNFPEGWQRAQIQKWVVHGYDSTRRATAS